MATILLLLLLLKFSSNQRKTVLPTHRLYLGGPDLITILKLYHSAALPGLLYCG